LTDATTSKRTKAGDIDANAKPLVQVRDLAVSFDNGTGPRIQAVDGVRMTIYPRQTATPSTSCASARRRCARSAATTSP
jgi:hypothetical protein